MEWVGMAGHTLLTRIRRPELATARRQISDAEVRESVLAHLRIMCTTRQGSMITSPTFGICDLSEIVHSFPDAIGIMAKALKQSIADHEPRLKNVVIRHVPTADDSLTLRFEIVGTIINGDTKANVKFETSIDDRRAVRVR
jgi:type VI secretion system protein